MLSLLAGLMLAGAAYSALKLSRALRKGKGKNNQGPPQGPPQEPVDAKPSNSKEAPVTKPEPKKIERKNAREDLINKVVRAIQLSERMARVVREVKVGERVEPSMVPTNLISVGPIGRMEDFRSALPSERAMPDDIQMARLASKTTLVRGFEQRIDIMEAEYGVLKNVLLVVQDVSGSMQKNNRASWSVSLNERLIDRCVEQEADYILVPFNEVPRNPFVAKDEEEKLSLKKLLPRILAPDGNTDISAALWAAMDILEEGKYGKGRIVLVSDGDNAVDVGRLRERLTALKVELHTVFIAGDNNDLRKLSDRYDTLRDETG